MAGIGVAVPARESQPETACVSARAGGSDVGSPPADRGGTLGGGPLLLPLWRRFLDMPNLLEPTKRGHVAEVVDADCAETVLRDKRAVAPIEGCGTGKSRQT